MTHYFRPQWITRTVRSVENWGKKSPVFGSLLLLRGLWCSAVTLPDGYNLSEFSWCCDATVLNADDTFTYVLCFYIYTVKIGKRPVLRRIIQIWATQCKAGKSCWFFFSCFLCLKYWIASFSFLWKLIPGLFTWVTCRLTDFLGKLSTASAKNISLFFHGLWG